MKNHKTIIVWILIFLMTFMIGFVLMKSLQTSLERSITILGADLYPRWVGAKAVLEGQSPYSFSTRQNIWEEIYGSSELPNGNPFGFYYPPSIVTLLIPIILLGIPLRLAAVLWCSFIWALWFTVLSYFIYKLPDRIPHKRLYTILLLLSAIIFRPAFSNYIIGQYALFSIIMLIGVWLSYQKKNDFFVGLFISLSLIKPSLTVIPVLLFLVFYYRSIKGYISIIAISLLLYLPPTIILGWWVPDFLNDISQYVIDNRVSWSLIDIKTISGIIWLILSISLVILGLVKKDKTLALSSSIALNAIFVPHTGNYDLVVLICLILWLGNRWFLAKKRLMLSESVFLVIILFPWISLYFFFQTGSPLAVENCSRFMWLVYPNLILLSALFTFLQQNMNILQTVKSFFMGKVFHN